MKLEEGKCQKLSNLHICFKEPKTGLFDEKEALNYIIHFDCYAELTVGQTLNSFNGLNGDCA